MAQWRCIKESRLAGETSIVSAFHPPLPPHSLPPRKRGRASAQSYIATKKYILEKREKERERDGEKLRVSAESRSNPQTVSNYEPISTIHVSLVPITCRWSALGHVPL